QEARKKAKRLKIYLKKNKKDIFQKFKYRSRRFGYLALRTQQSILRVNDDEASIATSKIFDTMYSGGKLGVYTGKKAYRVGKSTKKNTKRAYKFVRKNMSNVKRFARSSYQALRHTIRLIVIGIQAVLSFLATIPGIIMMVVLVLVLAVMILLSFINSLKLNETYDYGTITYNRITKLDYDANMGESQRYRDANIDALNKLQAIRDGAWSSDEDLTVIVPRRKKNADS
ncbi:MAG: hypothetical protein ACLT39_04545, partial [Peptoniphilus sp.]